MTSSAIRIERLSRFDDPRCESTTWNRLLSRGGTDAVFLTWEWQKAWWESFDRRGLTLLSAICHGEPHAIAPFFSEAGMVYFVGSGGSDYLDFIGDISDPGILAGLLSAARESVEDFQGFQLFHVRDNSPTSAFLHEVAVGQGLAIREEGCQAAPAAQLLPDIEAASLLTRKKSLLRHESYFRRCGEFSAPHLTTSAEIEPHLAAFFQQHIDRWAATGYPSLFGDARQQCFYRQLTRHASAAGWLRFTPVLVNHDPIAFHYGFCYRGTFMWYKPSFAIDQARHSPGEVLLRQLLLRAIDEGAHTFDFGLGDEAFKARFSNTTATVRNWGLYPAGKPLPEIWQ